MSEADSATRGLRGELGRLDVTPLRLLSRKLAAGHQLGMHHSRKKGAGLEFLGHREYVPGDDLRHLDRRALLRHGRYLIREFQIETERPLHLIVDGSASMIFGDPSPARGGEENRTKLNFAQLLAGASTLLARRANDPVGLTYWGDDAQIPAFFMPRAGMEQVERIFFALESAPVPGPKQSDPGSRLLETGSRLPRGTTVFWFSDFLDPIEQISEQLSLLVSRQRTIVLVQILTKTELDFPLRGALKLEDPETSLQTECEGDAVRDRYLERLSAHMAQLLIEATSRGAALLRVRTDEDPRTVLRNLTANASGRTV